MAKIRSNLYERMSHIENAISNTSDSAQLIGYAVMRGIIEFEGKATADEEIKLEQVKAIYQSLDTCFDSLRQHNLDSNATLCDMISLAKDKKEDFVSQTYKSESLQQSLQFLYGKKGNLEEKARKLGTALQNSSHPTSLPNNKSKMLSDYDQIKNYLRGKR